MLDALKQVLLSLQIRVGSTAPADAATARITAGAQKASAAWGAMWQGAMAALAVGAIKGQIDAVVDLADKNRKASEALGMTTDALQKLNYAADLAGVSTEEINKGLARFARVQTEAGKGGEDLTSMLMAEAETFRAMEDGPAKTARAMDLFGKSGVKLIPLLNTGAEGIREMGDEAQALGLVLGDKEARNAEAYNDAMLRVRSVFRGLRNRLVIELVPALTAAAEKFALWARQGDRVKRTADKLIVGFKLVASIVAAKKLVTGLTLVASGIKAIGNAGALASVKMGVLVGGLVLFALLIEDLYTFATGGDSLIGRYIDPEDAEELRSALQELGGVLKDLWEETKKPLFKAISDAIKWLAANAPAIIQGVTAAVKTMTKVVAWVGDAFKWVGKAAGEAAAWLYLAWQDAVDWLAIAIADVVAWFSTAWDDIVAFATNGATTIASFFKSIWDGITGTIDSVLAKIGEVWAWATGAVGAVADFLSSIGKGIGDWISGAIDSMIAELKAIVLSLPDIAVPDALKQWALEGVTAQGGTGTGGQVAGLIQRAEARASVGTVNVSVQGSTAMDAGAMAGAVDTGIRSAFDRMLSEALDDLGGEPA